MLQEAFLADLLHVVFRHDPAGRAGHRAVIGHEVRPRLLQDELHRVRIDDFDLFHLFMDQRALRPLEAVFHVFGRERVAVVKLDALAQLELVGELVLALVPRFRQARRHRVARHRLYQRVVQRVQDPERGQDALRRLARVHPRGRDRHVKRPLHLAFRLGLLGCPRRAGHQQPHRQHRGRGGLPPSGHRSCCSVRISMRLTRIASDPRAIPAIIPETPRGARRYSRRRSLYGRDRDAETVSAGQPRVSQRRTGTRSSRDAAANLDGRRRRNPRRKCRGARRSG